MANNFTMHGLSLIVLQEEIGLIVLDHVPPTMEHECGTSLAIPHINMLLLLFIRLESRGFYGISN
jgi:hypothetical protein